MITQKTQEMLSSLNPYAWGEQHLNILMELAVEINQPYMYTEIEESLLEVYKERNRKSIDRFTSAVNVVQGAISGIAKFNGITDVSVQKKLLELLEEVIDTEHLDYADNYRFAIKNSSESLAGYDKAQRSGCCGFFDQEVEINGMIYLYGCNFGH